MNCLIPTGSFVEKENYIPRFQFLATKKPTWLPPLPPPPITWKSYISYFWKRNRTQPKIPLGYISFADDFEGSPACPPTKVSRWPREGVRFFGWWRASWAEGKGVVEGSSGRPQVRGSGPQSHGLCRSASSAGPGSLSLVRRWRGSARLLAGSAGSPCWSRVRDSSGRRLEKRERQKPKVRTTSTCKERHQWKNSWSLSRNMEICLIWNWSILGMAALTSQKKFLWMSTGLSRPFVPCTRTVAATHFAQWKAGKEQARI